MCCPCICGYLQNRIGFGAQAKCLRPFRLKTSRQWTMLDWVSDALRGGTRRFLQSWRKRYSQEHSRADGACTPSGDRTGERADSLRGHPPVCGRKVRGANLFPAIVLAVIAAFLDKRNSPWLRKEPRRIRYFSNFPFFTVGSLIRFASAQPMKAKAVPRTTETNTSEG